MMHAESTHHRARQGLQRGLLLALAGLWLVTRAAGAGETLVIRTDPFSRRPMAAGRGGGVHPNVVEGIADEDAVTPEAPAPAPAAPAAPAAQPEPAGEGHRLPGTDLVVASPLYDPTLEEYRIRTGDVLSISIPYEPDTDRTVPVRPDGRITYLFDIEVMAAGLTYRQLNAVLRAALGEYYKNPRVTVIGQSFGGHSVFIMGPVGHPGRHPIQNDTRLLDVLSLAGAMSLLPQAEDLDGDLQSPEVVDLEGSYLARGKRVLDVDFAELLLERDLSQNVLLKPGDFIYIPASFSSQKRISVLGQVNEPYTTFYTGKLTFLQAIARADGPQSGGAWERRCFIIRGGIKQTKELIRVNYPAVLQGENEDLYLEDGDIVFVPKTPLFKTAEVIGSVLAPLRAVLELDNIAKNQFHEGDRQWPEIITKSRALGTY